MCRKLLTPLSKRERLLTETIKDVKERVRDVSRFVEYKCTTAFLNSKENEQIIDETTKKSDISHV